jgi:FtsP/CotA-like multicopper oxidase with cupredoxin domain
MKRRSVLAGLAAGTAALALPPALVRPTLGATSTGMKTLSIGSRTLEVNGKAATVFGLLGPDGLPGLRFRAGDKFDVLLRNETSESTIVHWHGLTPPWPSDGVPDAPLPLIGAGQERGFDFAVDRPGTYWMHAHTLQEQALLAAPLIVADPADDGRDEQEIVVLLHDFSFTPPEELLAGLTGGAEIGGMAGLGDKAGDAMAGMGHGTMSHGGMDMSGGMAMDLNDIEYDAYLANDRTLDDPEVFAVERGGRVRLRLINGATATAFTIDTGALEAELIAVDGQNVAPISGRRFPISMGQRIDLRLQLPNDATAFPILALREGRPERTGFVLKPAGATVERLAPAGDENGPVLDLALETALRAADPLAARAADKSFDMRLTGDMAAYTWGLDLPGAIVVDRGDRIEVNMTNMSMMAHPMHLHGHHFQVVAIDGKRFPGAVRDTVLVPPMRSVTIAVDANNPGQWAFHCHHLYHMATGMMSTFGYRT